MAGVGPSHGSQEPMKNGTRERETDSLAIVTFSPCRSHQTDLQRRLFARQQICF